MMMMMMKHRIAVVGWILVVLLAPVFLLAPTRLQLERDRWSLELINSWIDAINAAATGSCASILTKAVEGIERARDTRGVYWMDMPYHGFTPNDEPSLILIKKDFQPPAGSDGVSPVVDGRNIGNVVVHEGLHATFDPQYQLRGMVDDATYRLLEATVDRAIGTCWQQVQHPMMGNLER